MRQLTDMNVFEKATIEVFNKLKITSNIMGSGIVKGDSAVKSMLSEKGTGIALNLPFLDRTVGRTWTGGSDNSADIVAQKVVSGSGLAYTCYRNISISAASILDTIEKTGISSAKAAMIALGDEYVEMKESKLIATIEGVIAAAESDANLDVVNDIGATKLDFNALVDTEALAYNDTEFIVMNKKTLAVFKKDVAATYIPKDKSINKDFDTIDGKKVIISKKFADGTVALFEKGAIISEDITPAGGDFAYIYDKKANGGSGSEEVLLRTANIMFVEGFSFTGTPADKFNPTDVELATGSNYTFTAGSSDNCPFVILKGALS